MEANFRSNSDRWEDISMYHHETRTRLEKNWENVGLPVKVPVSKISADIKELFQGDISNEYVGRNIYERHTEGIDRFSVTLYALICANIYVKNKI